MQCFTWISVYSKCGPCIFPSEIANTVLMFCYYHYTRRWFSIIHHPLDFPSINRRKSEIMLHIISFKRRSTAYYKHNIESLRIRYLCCFMPIVNSSVHWFNFVVIFFSLRTSFWFFVLVWFFNYSACESEREIYKNCNELSSTSSVLFYTLIIYFSHL